MGKVKGIGGRVAGCTRWDREGKTDSRSRTWVAPESARIGEGVIEHKRAGFFFRELRLSKFVLGWFVGLVCCVVLVLWHCCAAFPCIDGTMSR